jgi:hypothetical protein
MDASGHSYANGAMVFAAMEVEGSVVRRKRTRSHEEASNARTRDAASGDTTVAGVVAAARTITAVVLEGRTGSLIIARHMSNAINRFHLEIQRFKHRGSQKAQATANQQTGSVGTAAANPSNIPEGMLALFQQFLESLANKQGNKSTPGLHVNQEARST